MGNSVASPAISINNKLIVKAISPPQKKELLAINHHPTATPKNMNAGALS